MVMHNLHMRPTDNRLNIRGSLNALTLLHKKSQKCVVACFSIAKEGGKATGG